MKKIFWMLSVVMTVNLAVPAQNQKKASTDAKDRSLTQSSKVSGSGSSSATTNASALSAGTSIEGRLQNSLDVRKAKVGDPVFLKTTRAVRQNGETIVPKGSNLVGRVTEVQQKAKGNSASRLGIVFDRIQAGKMTMPITASIMSITNIHAASSVSDFDTDLMGSSSGSARTSSGTSGGGGGLLGGATGAVGGVVNTATQTVGGVADTAAHTLGAATQTVGGTLNGIQISQSVSGSVQGSSTLSSQDKNIHLEKGVTFLLQVNSTGGN